MRLVSSVCLVSFLVLMSAHAEPKLVTPGIKNPTAVKTVKTETISTDSTINIMFDRAEVLPLEKGVASLIVGNPLIADVSVQQGGFMVVTAKGNGTTNFIGLDSKGNTIFNRLIKVRPVSEQVVRVYRVNERETLTCAPACARTPTIGDSNDIFSQGLSQSTTRTATINGASGSGQAAAR